MNRFKRLLYSWIDNRFLGGCSSYNSLETRRSCRSKKQARSAFRKNGVPHAHGDVFWGPFAPFQFIRDHGFPVVVKPNIGGFSRGSHFPITSKNDLFKAIFAVKIWWPSSIIEEYIKGKNYRIVVVKDDIMAVIRRYPPFVTGDGKSTIAELIDRENDIRRKMSLYPVIHPLKKDINTEKYIKKKKKSLSSIPRQGEIVTLHNKIALASGGIVETIDKSHVHPDNRELVLKLLKYFNANILGIDAIFEKGIEVSHSDQRSAFLEVNSRPYLKMHDYPRIGEKPDLQGYFEHLESLDIEQQDIF